MENRDTNEERENIWREEVIDRLIFMRDLLVETSEGLRDLLFQMESPKRREANEIAEEILKTVKR
jgi:hypothetical protein